MVVRCAEVWQEISNYLDGEVDPGMRTAMEEHFRGCGPCTAILNGTKNVVQLYGDERMLEVPAGFSQRLHRKLEQGMPRRRGSVFGWMMALGFAALMLLSFEVGNFSPGTPDLRSDMARSAVNIPPELRVVAVADGRVFHVPGCRFIHDKDKVETMTAGEALREGYVPCVRCLKKYLSDSRVTGKTETQSARLNQEDAE